MPKYTIRIQLVGKPSEEVYADLHQRMEKGGFYRTVKGVDDDGNTVTPNLPHGTYYGTSEATCLKVREWATAHAKEAWGKSIIFVAETSTWSLS